MFSALHHRSLRRRDRFGQRLFRTRKVAPSTDHVSSGARFECERACWDPKDGVLIPIIRNFGAPRGELSYPTQLVARIETSTTWQEFYDLKTNKMYYWNPTTNTVSRLAVNLGGVLNFCMA